MSDLKRVKRNQTSPEFNQLFLAYCWHHYHYPIIGYMFCFGEKTILIITYSHLPKFISRLLILAVIVSKKLEICFLTQNQK